VWERSEVGEERAKWERGWAGEVPSRRSYLREVPPIDDVACRLLLEIHVTAHAPALLLGYSRVLAADTHGVRPIGPYRFGAGTLWAVEAERRIVGKIVRANVGGERTQHICRRGAEPSCRGG
jgi:hypothetical protein